MPTAPKKKAPRKTSAVKAAEERLAEGELTLGELIAEDKRPPSELIRRLSFDYMVTDQKQKIADLQRIMKMFDDDQGMSDDEVLARVPEDVLTLIADLKDRGHTPDQPGME